MTPVPADNLKEPLSYYWVYFWFIIWFTFILLLGITGLSKSFQQRLTVLAPAITDKEYKLFDAKWANMRSKADYDALNAVIEERAKQSGITLPPADAP